MLVYVLSQTKTPGGDEHDEDADTDGEDSTVSVSEESSQHEPRTSPELDVGRHF
jgi:hypothetical protein